VETSQVVLDTLNDVVQKVDVRSHGHINHERLAGSIDKMTNGVYPDYEGIANVLNNLKRLTPDMVRNAQNIAVFPNGVKSGEHGEKHHEPAEEVFWALATQVPAVESLVYLTSNHILPAIAPSELPKEERIQRKVLATLSATAITSGIADNVAAYLFCEDTLNSVMRDELGEEEFRANEDLRANISTSALLVATVAGGLTKLGNGPNFTQTVPQLDLEQGSDNELNLRITRKPRELNKTLTNAYAYAFTAAAVAVGTKLISESVSRNVQRVD
jgi:hypothetical protein